MLKSRIRRSLLVFLCALPAMAHAQQGDIVTIRPDSPETHVVVEGDTLWDIAGVFLEEPWLWPEIWQVNPQIENPDLIYPGDVIALSYQDGQPVLTLQREGSGLERPDDLTVRRVSPEVRRAPLLSPVPAIALDDISPFLSRNRIVGEAELEDAPVVLASRSGRRFSRPGDVIYAAGFWREDITLYDIVRPVRKIEDPDNGDTIAIEATLVGTASIVERQDTQASLIIDDSKEEVREGDFLIPGDQNTLAAEFFPRPPDFDVNAGVVDIDFGRTVGGRYDTLVISAGGDDGMSPGTLLSLRKADDVVANPDASFLDFGEEDFIFTGETYGRILVYKVFDNHSFALVLSSSLPVEVEDRAVTP